LDRRLGGPQSRSRFGGVGVGGGGDDIIIIIIIIIIITTTTTTTIIITTARTTTTTTTPCSRVPLEKLTVTQLVKKSPAFY
jgi:hypothetical protein